MVCFHPTPAHLTEGAMGELTDSYRAIRDRGSVNDLLVIAQRDMPGGRRPSQNDIFVLAKSKRGPLFSIMVEGKVEESFGNHTVSEWLTQDQHDEGRKERLAYLLEVLGLKNRDVSGIRYQLLHRTASALIEAKTFNCEHAMMLVHSFSSKNSWFEDYAAFVELYGIKAELNTVHRPVMVNGIQLYFGWVKGEERFLLV